MRLSHPLLDSVGFQFTTINDLLRVLESECQQEELDAVAHLFATGLPPITSAHVLASMLGINPGLIWSFQHRTNQYYRNFYIKKGSGKRAIQAPRVALKLIQKWVSVVLGNTLKFPDHVYGFIQGRSHINAALVHINAHWVFGLDIRDFFRSTPKNLVQTRLVELGYPLHGAKLLADLTCLNGFLAQGAPSSPILSNLCFSEFDIDLQILAKKHNCRLTRYADDIVFSGCSAFPEVLRDEVLNLFTSSPWVPAPEKIKLNTFPERLKVHGLLVDGNRARLTKGYRNKLRAFNHVLTTVELSASDRSRLSGHVNYSNFVERVIEATLKVSE